MSFHNILPQIASFAVPIDELNHDPRNARVHPERNVDAIKTSLSEHGQDQFLVVQRDGMIVRKGNGRLQAARELGWTHVAALVVDENTPAAVRRALADNRTSDLATNDDALTAEILEDLMVSDPDFVPPAGFTVAELDELLGASGDVEDGIDYGRANQDDYENHDKEVSRAIVRISVGEYRLTIDPAAYDAWKDKVGKSVGFDDASVREHIADLLGIDVGAVHTYKKDRKRYRGENDEG